MTARSRFADSASLVSALAIYGVLLGVLASLAWRWIGPPTFRPPGPIIAIARFSAEAPSPSWVPTWPGMAAALILLGAVVLAAAGYGLTGSRWSWVRDGRGSRRLLITILMRLGFGAGVVAALTIVAVPYGVAIEHVGDRLPTLTRMTLSDTDLMWWLIAPVGALFGAAVGMVMTTYDWRLRRAMPDR